MNIELVKAKDLRPGERAIMVDGVRWGRTVVTHHGMHGKRYTFQDTGWTATEPNGRGGAREVTVKSSGDKRKTWRWTPENPWRSTEERVLDKVKELIETGQLRHPDIVKAANARAREEYRNSLDAADAARRESFRARAMEALNINDPDSEIVTKVAALMEWAQSQ